MLSPNDYLTLVQPWTLGPSRVLAKTRVMTLKERWCASPDNPRKAGMYVYLDATPWVNVVALTPDKHVVMIEQFRHGIGKVTLELAGGIVERDEDHALAGDRELLEETGYKGTNHGIIGQVSANPAILNNMVSTVLVTDCTPAGKQELDGN
jgi:8-oxo-dGTP pyrophosphatase MutT (NUDIX family)